MTIAQTTHPTPQQLAEYSRGKLSVTDDLQIEEHLSQCDTCCETLNCLPDDTLIAILKDDNRDSGHRPTLAGDAAATADGNQGNRPLSLPAELDRYRIAELIGEGGMGAVYKAEHRMMQRTVALKLINSRLINRPGAVERFHREVQAAARLSHPNIVTSHDACRVDDLHFLVMEYVDGIDLADVVKQQDTLSVERACDYIRQAALGLQHAHEQGMVHRDIKPHNLMLTRVRDRGQQDPASTNECNDAGTIKILDFGLASLATETIEQVGSGIEMSQPATSQLTMAGTTMGTPDFMSPEQADDARTADIRSDIYALGATFYYLLAGRPPFAEGTVMQKLAAHRNLDPPSIDTLRADVPVELAAVIRRMMAKDPAERYTTPAEVADALAPFVDRHRRAETANRPPEAKQPVASDRRRRPVGLRIAVAAVSLFLLAGAATAAVVYVVTDKGTLQIRSSQEVDVIIRRNGEIVEIVDADSGHQMVQLRSGKYEIEVENGNDQFTLSKNRFELRRGDKVIVEVGLVPPQPVSVSLHRVPPTADLITQTGVVSDSGGWRIESKQPRTFRLVEVPVADIDEGRLTYRAEMKTKDLEGRAYLEMWVRIPGRGEFFSKGLHNPVTGTSNWSEIEIPFQLAKGQTPDLVKLNVVIEGRGTVWIKNAELLAAIPADGTMRDVLASRNGPAELAGLQHVTRDFIAAAVIHPQAILNKPISKSAKLFLSTLFKQDLGIEMQDVAQVVLLAPDPMPTAQRRDPSFHYAAVIRFAEPIDVEARLNQMLVRPAKTTVGEATVYIDRQGIAAFAPDGRTIVRGPRELLLRMSLSSKPQGPLAEQLQTVDLNSDVVAVVINQGSVRQSIVVATAMLRQRIGPHLAADSLRAPEAVVVATLSLNLSPNAKMTLRLNSTDRRSAEMLERVATFAIDESRSVLAKFSAGLHSQSMAADQLMLRSMSELLRTARVAHRDRDVLVTSIMPAGLADEVLTGMITRAQQAAEDARTRNKLKQIGLAMHNYHDTHKCFAPSQTAPAEQFDEEGRPRLSWRVHILPFLGDEAAKLYPRFRLNEAWDSEHNLTLLGEMPDVYRTTQHADKTTILAVVGSGTAYEGKRGVRFRDIRDGTSNTVLAVVAGDDKALPWTQPRDLPFHEDDPAAALGQTVDERFHAIFCDGSVQSIQRNLLPASLRALFTRAAADKIDRTTLRTKDENRQQNKSEFEFRQR